MKSGFVAVAGRPNVGKSSILNQLVGQKVSITANRPQTTRFAIRGILTRPDAQIVFVDTPGLHKPKSALGQRLNSVVRDWIHDVDVVAAVFDASSEIGSGDKFVTDEIFAFPVKALAIVNKADKVLPPVLLSQMEKVRALGDWVDVLTTSAKRGTGFTDLADTLVGLMPEGPQLYPAETVTDTPEDVAIAELIREKAVMAVKEEVPHSIAVVVNETEAREGKDLIDIYATLYVERDSQKGILIGAGGKMLKKIATQARMDIEKLLGSQVYLDLVVKVEHEWQRDERALERFGY